MNILLTSVGRRGYLVEYFRDALRGRGRVVCANMYADTAGMYAADEAVIVPPSDDSSYIETIVGLCRNGEIRPGSRVLFWHTGGLMNLLTSEMAVDIRDSVQETIPKGDMDVISWDRSWEIISCPSCAIVDTENNI